MMRAKADPKAATTPIFALACVLLAAAAVGLVWPKPRAKSTQAGIRKQESIARQARTDSLVARSIVQSRTWVGEDSAITAGILNLTTTLARKRNVGFVRLVPQRADLGGQLERLPYQLVVEGRFPDVAALEKDLEVPANRLAVSAFQVASSDTETNKVSATIGIVAQRVAPDVGTKEKNDGKGS